jgi:tetratricopeptide (TPR) repeat protein
MGQKHRHNSFPLAACGLLALSSILGCSLFSSKQPQGVSSSITNSGAIGQPFGSSNPAATRSSGVIAANGNIRPGAAQFDPLVSVKDGLEKAGELLTFTEPVQQAPDPTALSTKAKPSPRLYVAMARLAEESNQPANAESYYEKALSMDPTYLEALLGLGRLNDRQGKLETALSYYQKATKAHPNEPSTWNHLGLCYARMNRLKEARSAIEKAISLAPKEPRYRHNLATILVRSGDLPGALQQLQAVHDEATACYNLGYLLAKKGDRAAAAHYFGRALQLKPDFQEARQWLDAISPQQVNELAQRVSAASGQLPLPASSVLQTSPHSIPTNEGRSAENAVTSVRTEPQGLQVTDRVAPLPPVLEEETIQISDGPEIPMPCPLPPVYD